MDTTTSRTSSRRLSFDTAGVWVLSLSLALAAIAFIPSASVPFIATKTTLLALLGLVALALFILGRLTRGSIIVPPLALVGALWLVPLAYGLSTLFSGTSFSAAFYGSQLEPDTFGFMLLVAALGTLAALMLRRSGQYLMFFRVLMAGLAIALVVQVLFVIIGQFSTVVSPATSIVGSLSDLGMLSGLGLVLSLMAMRFLPLASRTRLALYIGGVVALVVVALLNSALIWTLVALAALGLFIEAILRRRGTAGDDMDLAGIETLPAEEPVAAEAGSQPLALSLVVLAVALFFIVGGSTLGPALTNSLHASTLDVRPSWQATFQVGKAVYGHSAFFGSGPDSFATAWTQYRDRSINDTLFWNLGFSSGIGFIPTSFVTTGVVGVIAWLGFLGLFLFFGLRSLLMRAPEDSFIRFVSVASFVGAAYVLLLAIFAVPGPVVLAAGFLFAGAFASTLRYGAKSHELGIAFSRSPRIGFVIVFFLTLLLLATVLAAYVVTERYFGTVAYLQAGNAATAGNLDAAEADISRAILFSPTDDAYRLAASIAVARMNQVAGDTTLSADAARTAFQSALSSAVANALAATQRAPGNAQNWAALGSVYATVVPLKIDGAYDNAKSAYDKAVALAPTDPTLQYAEAQLAIENQDAPGAEKALQAAINLKPDYTQAIFLLSQLEVQEGKAKEALQAAEAAAYFAPTDPSVLFQVGILRSATGDQDGAIAALSAAVQAAPQYANAHFFLAVAYAAKAQYQQALTELQAVAALSPDNAAAVADDITQLQAGKNPFPPTTTGLPNAPVSDGTPATGATPPAGTPTAAPGAAQ